MKSHALVPPHSPSPLLQLASVLSGNTSWVRNTEELTEVCVRDFIMNGQLCAVPGMSASQ